MDHRREKEGVVILSHFDKIIICNSHPKVGNGSREEKKREWLFLVILTRSSYATHILKLGMDQRRE